MKTSRIEALVTNTVITLLIDGKVAMIRKGDSQFEPVLKKIKENKLQEVESLLLSPSNISKQSFGTITIEDGEVKFKGKIVKNPVVGRIKEFIVNGLPTEPLIKFLKKLLSNPSEAAIEQLYNFLEHRNMPITQEGNFLAYKKVQEDYLDFYSKKFSNKPGSEHKMRKDAVDANPDNYCSDGFHVGSLNYANLEYHPNDGRIVIVEVNPQHAVSVPKDYQGQKLRTWKYKVIADYEGPLVQAKVVMSSNIRSAIAKIHALRKGKKGRNYVSQQIEKIEQGMIDRLTQLTIKQVNKKDMEAIKWLIEAPTKAPSAPQVPPTKAAPAKPKAAPKIQPDTLAIIETAQKLKNQKKGRNFIIQTLNSKFPGGISNLNPNSGALTEEQSDIVTWLLA